MFKYYFDL